MELLERVPELLVYLKENLIAVGLVFAAVVGVLNLGLALSKKTKWTWDNKLFRFLLDLVLGLKKIVFGLVKGGVVTGTSSADQQDASTTETQKKARVARKRTVRES